MLKIKTGEHEGKFIIKGDPEEVTLEMATVIKVFYIWLKRKDILTALAFKELLTKHFDILEKIPFREMEIKE